MTNEEIDKLCGLHVMGWTFVPGPEGSWYDAGVLLVATEDWSPTTDIHEAWQVLGQFPTPKFYVTLQSTYTGNWRCDIDLRGGDGPKVSAYDASVPMAICLAALKAVGVEVRP